MKMMYKNVDRIRRKLTRWSLVSLNYMSNFSNISY